MQISSREQKIIKILLNDGVVQSSTIHKELLKQGDSVSLVTIKRALSDMVVSDMLMVHGSGRTLSYEVSLLGRIFADIDPNLYCAVEPDQRHGSKRYNPDLFLGMPDTVLSPQELKKLEDATAEYTRRTTNVSPALEKRELERLVIELSWKSSKIEGNTYTLLDTEKLILENTEAPGHDHSEAQMILNHKDAFNFIRENAVFFKTLKRSNIEDLYAILVKGLPVGTGLRRGVVGVIGSTYQPLDNQHQISEGLEALIVAVARMQTPYEKALVALLGISYLQPFEDGNKRTARLLANAILLAYECAPLSYRSVAESDYREATLVFYEINSIIPFKRIFIEQYDFAARNYTVK